MKIQSSAFAESTFIPKLYTCDGQDKIPPMQFLDVPAETKSLALIIDDPDAALSGGWDHYVGWNISSDTKEVKEGVEPAAVDGKNSWSEIGYKGPCPPAEHRYYFKLFALDTKFDLPKGATKKELLKAMQGHILEKAELMGKYKR
jgi:hypothetical protein